MATRTRNFISVLTIFLAYFAAGILAGNQKCVQCTYHPDLKSPIKDIKDGCQDPRLHETDKIKDANFCIWIIGHDDHKGSILRLNSDKEYEDVKPGTCKLEFGEYYCACEGNLCNKEKPPCDWITKANPSDKDPKGCTEKGKCVQCTYHPDLKSPIKDIKEGCQDPRLHEKNKITNANYCTWVIGYEDNKGSVLRLDSEQQYEDVKPGACKLEFGEYYCGCEGSFCNQEKPPCDWLRKANPSDKNPKGCDE